MTIRGSIRSDHRTEDLYRVIASGVGGAAPIQAVAWPLVCAGTLLGVLEVATLRAFNSQEKALLEELLPVVAMLAYEYIRFSARHLDNPFIHAITVPNLAMQKLTTREPDDTMVQVAIEALKKVLDAEQNRPLNPEYLIP